MDMKAPGIYAFMENEEVVYVGYTTRPIEIRLKEHYCEDLERIREKIDEGRLYDRSFKFHSALKQPDRNFKVEVLYSAEVGDTKSMLEMYELFFINWFKPQYNSAGVICDYYFSSDDFKLDWDAIRQYQNGCSWETAKKKSREIKTLKTGF